MALFSRIKKEQVKFAEAMKVLGRTTAGAGEGEEVAILDENNMVSDSATSLATQQSIKAYVDAQTTTLLATDIKIGEDDETKIDFETGDEIHFYAANAHQIKLVDGALVPATNNDIDLGTSVLEFKNAYFDGTVTSDAFAGDLTGDVTGNADTATVATTVTITDNESTDENNAIIFAAGGDVDGGNLGLESDGTLTYNPSSGTLTATAFVGDITGTSSKATVTDSDLNTNFPVVFHDESDALLDDTGALRYNPSTGTLLVPNLTVAGTTTQVNTVTMNAANAVVFEGATADDNETTLSIVDPTADRTQYLINAGGYIPVLAAVTTDAITATPAELNILNGATVVVGEINALDLGVTAIGNAIASKAVILDANLDYTGVRNFALTGELDAGSLDISGNADIAGDLVLSAGGEGALNFTAASSIKIKDDDDAALIIENDSGVDLMTFKTNGGGEVITNKPLNVLGGLLSLGLQDRNFGRFDVGDLSNSFAARQNAALKGAAGNYEYAVWEGTLKRNSGGSAVTVICYPTGGNSFRKGALDLCYLNGVLQAVDYLDGDVTFASSDGAANTLTLGAGIADADGGGEFDSSKVEMLRLGKIDGLIFQVDSAGGNSVADNLTFLAVVKAELESGDNLRIIGSH